MQAWYATGDEFFDLPGRINYPRLELGCLVVTGRGSIGTGITGCLPRITSSGPPSRRMTKGNVGKPRDAATGGHAVGGHVADGDVTGHGCDSCDKLPSHDTSRR